MKLVYVHRPENILGERAYSQPQALEGLGQNALYLNRTHDFLITAQCNRAQWEHVVVQTGVLWLLTSGMGAHLLNDL